MAKRILLAVKDQGLRESVDALLTESYTVVPVRTDREAIRRITFEPFHLVIVDNSFRDSTVNSLVAEARKPERERPVPVLILVVSGDDHGLLVDRAQGFLTVPMDSTELFSKIERAVSA